LNQSDATTSAGTIKRTVMAASRTLVANRMMVITTMVSPWMASWESPSCRSCWRFSMSLVIRDMITPAFSSVKKPSESRWRWANTLTLRSFITQAANRPDTCTWARWLSAVTTTDSR
jgi:hypothetical protein